MPWCRFEMMVPVGVPWGDDTTGRLYRSWLGWLILLVLLFAIRPAGAREAGEIVSVLGAVEVLREGGWQVVGVGEVLKAGEMVRTGESSRVAIQLANGSQLKLNANSRLELKTITAPTAGISPASIQPQSSILHFINGEIWIRTVGEPLEVQSLPATATVRGTEFNLAVGPNDIARLAVLDGRVEFSNSQGSVLVAANEQATAKVGEAPRKTVLLDPLDAVQWSLYYPGLVSYRDYPLSGIDPSRLRPRIEALRGRVAASFQDVTALIELGEANFDVGDRREARQAFARALQIDPRQPRARAGLGWVYLEAGEVDAALGEFQKSRPPTLMALIGQANALYRLNRLDEADQVLAEAKKHFPRSPAPWTQAALNDLIRGRVTDARQALDRALALDPNDTLAYGLRSNIHLVQNQKDLALEAARRAVATNPFSPTAYLDLSLAYQAEFQLEDALRAAHQAVGLDPENPRALIQESRLLFGMGRIEKASKVAEKAWQRAPRDALVNSTRGFLRLALGHTNEASKIFQEAIAQDSTLGEPHLGLGLALFRSNRTEAAVEEMRKATLLEPMVSLYNSYLGKAYYEIKDDRFAQKYLAAAKRLDPHDPTPHFYDAVRLQSVNRPVEAVRDLQKSIELNDNRAIYRSKLLLDQDLATRDASLANSYDDLGFEQLAQVEATKSLSLDPANYSAHRFLSDSYVARPRHEIARVSELLQAQLLQPININPIQPRLNEINLKIIDGFGATALNEYTSLFERDRTRVLASGLAGNNATLAEEVVLSGLEGPLSYSLGQFHYQTDGFRENADLQHDIYDAFVQVAVTSRFNLQAEYRGRKTENGDLGLRFDASDFNPRLRSEFKQDTARLGAHFVASSQSDVIVSLIHSDRQGKTMDFTGDDSIFGFSDDEGYLIEAQYLFRADGFNLITGVGGYNIDVQSREEPVSCAEDTCLTEANFSAKQNNAYFYTNIAMPKNTIWTFGLGYNTIEQNQDRFIDLDSINPKFGLRWNITDNAQLRLAAFKTLKPRLVVQQTIEPSQVAGFNQFFDEPNGTTAESYGIGLDFRLTENLYGGVEGFRRNLEIPIFNDLPSVKEYEFLDGQEKLYFGYLYWIPHPQWAIRLEYRSDKFFESGEFRLPPEYTIISGQPSILGTYQVDTISVPLTVRYFNSSGLFSEIGMTYVHQDVEKTGLLSTSSAEPVGGSENFVLLDAAIGYRLPKRWGLLSLEARNLLDKKFHFEDLSERLTPETGNPLFIPERLVLARFALNF